MAIHKQTKIGINANQISGTINGDRLPLVSANKRGALPPTGTPLGRFLKDDGTWAAVEASAGGGLSQAQILTRML